MRKKRKKKIEGKKEREREREREREGKKKFITKNGEHAVSVRYRKGSRATMASDWCPFDRKLGIFVALYGIC